MHTSRNVTPRAHLAGLFGTAVVGALTLGAAPAFANDLIVNTWTDNNGSLVLDTTANAWTNLSKGAVQPGGYVLVPNFGTETTAGIKATVTSATALGNHTFDITLADAPVVSIDVVRFANGDVEVQSLDMINDPAPLPGDGIVANDDCSGAIAIGFGTTVGSTAGAGVDAAPLCGTSVSAPGVWYSVTGTGAAMSASTCTANFGYDTKVSVYTDGCGTLTCVDGNDDSCVGGASGLLSTVNWASNAGQEYLVLVHGFGTASGSFDLVIDGDTPPVATGACCFSDGSCEILSEDDCGAGGGAYQGDDTACFAAGNATNYAGSGGAIPDFGLGAFSDTINVGDSGTVGDVDVNLAVNHTWTGDLTVDLTHGATTVTIIDRQGEPVIGAFGCSEDNFNVTIDDEAASAFEDQCAAGLTGSYTPNNALSAFDGSDSLGDWTLTVTDNAGGDTGSVAGWSIDIGGAGEPLCPEPECFLVVGDGEGNDPYVGSGHVFTTQINGIEAGYFTLMEDLPTFKLPAAPSRNGNNLVQGMGQGIDPNAGVPDWMLDGSFSVQIMMWNPTVFPGFPEQYTTGVHVQIQPNGRVLTQPFGNSTGMTIGADVDYQARTIQFPFVVPGL